MQGREEGRDAVSAHRAIVNKGTAPKIESSSFVCADAHREVELVKNLFTLRWSKQNELWRGD
jgi:hypothetical protein